MPIVDILFKVAKDNAIKTISQMVLQPYKSARCFLGAPLYTVS